MGINGIPYDHWGVCNSNFGKRSGILLQIWAFLYPMNQSLHSWLYIPKAKFNSCTCMRISRELSSQEQKAETTRMPLRGEWVNTWWSIQTLEYNAIVKINKITVGVTTWQCDLFSCSGVRKASLRSWHTPPMNFKNNSKQTMHYLARHTNVNAPENWQSGDTTFRTVVTSEMEGWDRWGA